MRISDLNVIVYGSDACAFVFFKQKAAYEMRISDWSSDVCSSDLRHRGADRGGAGRALFRPRHRLPAGAGRRPQARSEERRGGKECVSTCRSRSPPYHEKNHTSTADLRHATETVHTR